MGVCLAEGPFRARGACARAVPDGRSGTGQALIAARAGIASLPGSATSRRRRRRAIHASGASAARWTHCGGNAAHLASILRVNSASSSGFGILFIIVRPSSASATAGFGNLLHRQRRPDVDAGMIAASSPALAKSCATPAWNEDDVPGIGDDPFPSHAEAHRSPYYLEPLFLVQLHVLRPGHALAGGQLESMVTSSPFVSAAVARKVMRSPLAGFSSVCPVRAIVVPPLFAARPVCARNIGASMTEERMFMLERPRVWTHAARPRHTRSRERDRPRGPTDPLAEALQYLRMNGAFYCRSELSAPWGLTLMPMPGYLWFHVVTHGRVLLETPDGATALRPGDFALVPHGEGHVLRSDPDAPAPGILELERELVSDRYEILRHGGGGAPTMLICGAVRFDHPAARNLVDVLPDTIHVEASGSPQLDWMQSTLRLMAAEAGELRPGSEAVITRLADILVVQAIRSCSRPIPVPAAGG